MRKVLIMFLAVAMTICILPATVSASEFSDMPDDWSTEALESAVANGLLTGTNGKLMPKDNLTRAQMAVVINRAFGATQKASLDNYTDVATGTWYYDDMAKAVHMKTFVGSGTKLNPYSEITREEAFVVLSNAFKLSGSSESGLDKFLDKSTLSSWAKDSVASLISAGYVKGVNNRINPKKNITRAEFAQVLHNIIKNYITTAGTYTEVADGSLMINVPDVTLKNVTISGDLIIGDGVGEGDITLDNVKVTGRTVVRGGGVNSIKIVGNSEFGRVVVSKVNGNVRIVSESGATVEVVYIDDGKDDVIVEGTIGSVEVALSNVPVTIQNAQVENVLIKAPNANLTVGDDTTVNVVTVSQGAQSSTVTANEGANITNVKAEAPNITIGGDGIVKSASIQGDNSCINTVGTKVEVGDNVNGTTSSGEAVPSGTTGTITASGRVSKPSSGGGSSSVRVSEITVIGASYASTVVNGGTLQLSAFIQPSNATNKTITWSVVTLEGGTATIDENGLLTGTEEGTVRVTATNVNSGVTGTLEVTVITVDKTALNEVITAEVGADRENQVYVLTEADYTPESWSAFEEAISEALVVEGNANSIQEEVDAAVTLIEGNKAALVFAGQADLDIAEAATAGLTESDYLAASWVALEIALALPETTNAEVVDKTTAINNAIAALVFAGQADLDAAKATAAALIETDYTTATWTVLTDALASLEITNADVVAKTTVINNAIADLVFAGQADLDIAKAAAAGLTDSDYTIVTWAELETALALPETTNAEVVDKTTAINEAIAALIEVADMTAYNAALSAVVEVAYTAESWAVYQTVVNANIVTDQDLQTEVDAATTAITAAQADLVFAGQADLEAALAVAAALIESDYTTATWTVLTDALALPEITNAEVVSKTTAINNAIAALVFVGQADLDIAEAATAGLTESDYLAASWVALEIALALPETTNAEVVDKTTAINNAIALLTVDKTALTAAITAEVGADHANPVYVLSQSDYIEATWIAYVNAVAAAIVVENDGNAVQSEINAAQSAIASTKAALEMLTFGITIDYLETFADPILLSGPYGCISSYSASDYRRLWVVRKTGTGDITNLNASLGGTNPEAFILYTDDNWGNYWTSTLTDDAPSTYVGISPKDGLPAGNYNTTVTITADHGVSLSVNINFKVV